MAYRNENTQQCRTNDLTGKKFGMLTAVGPTSDRYYNSVVWLCRCDCGNDVLRSASQLKAGLKLSCGCMKRKTERHPEDNVTCVAGTTVELLRTPRVRSDNIENLEAGASQTVYPSHYDPEYGVVMMVRIY